MKPPWPWGLAHTGWRGLDHSLGQPAGTLARDAEGRLAGFGCVAQFPGIQAGRVKATVVVAPSARGRGLGTALVSAVEQKAREMKPHTLYGELRDDDPAGLESRLDLAAFDGAPFSGLIPALEVEGFRFFRLKGERSLQNDRKAYETAKETHEDIPGSPESQPPFERWCQIVLDSNWFPPEGVLVADDTTKPEIDRFAGFAP